MSPVKSPEQPSARDMGKKDKIVVEKGKADELPPGWKVEMKKRKARSATKTDRFYTDPVTGYIFRSLKDAQRYVKTGKVGRLAMKPKDNECVDMDNKDKRLHMEEMSETSRRKRPVDMTRSRFSETGKSELLHHASKKLAAPSQPPPEPKTRQATRLAGVAVDASPSPVEPKTCKSTRKAGIEIDATPSSLPDTRTNRVATRQAGIKIDASVTPPPAPKTCQAAQQSGMKIDSLPSSPDSKPHQATPSQPEPKTRQAKRLYGVRDNSSPASLPQPKTRRATRQAGIKIDSPPPSLPYTRTSCQAAKARQVNFTNRRENDKKTEVEKMAEENADMDNNTNHNQETSINTSPAFQENVESPKEHNKEIDTGHATVVPPVDLEKQELCVVNPTVSNAVLQNGYGYEGGMKSDSSIYFSMNDLWTDPCIEFSVKILTGAIPCGDLNKPENPSPAPSPSPLKVPLEELWTDPCIDFAVKTLTGAIPVGEHNYLQQRPSISRNTRADMGMSFFQTDVFSRHFETGHDKQQQDSSFGNGGL